MLPMFFLLEHRLKKRLDFLMKTSAHYFFFQSHCRMPSGGYIAGKALTRWEADTDNIDIDYRSLEGDHRCKWLSECFSGRKGQVLRVLLVLVLFCVGLIVGYIIRRNVHEQFIAPTFRCEESSPQVSFFFSFFSFFFFTLLFKYFFLTIEIKTVNISLTEKTLTCLILIKSGIA